MGLSRVSWLIAALAAGACVSFASVALAQDEDIPSENVDKGEKKKKKKSDDEAEPADKGEKGDEGEKAEEKPKDEMGGWGVGGTESEGKFRPHGKTGKLKEIEKEKEEDRLREEQPLDLGPPGYAWVDFANTPSGTITVPVFDSGPTQIKPGASFLIGVGYRFAKKYEVDVRFGVSTAAINGPREPVIVGAHDPDAFKQIATGNLELGFKPHFHATQTVVLVPGLAFDIPTAMGDMYADADNHADLARAIVNQAAAAMRGWEDRALWEPHRFGIVPSFGVLWQRQLGPGALKLDARTKWEIMVRTGGIDPTCATVDQGACQPYNPKVTDNQSKDVAVNWVIGGGAFYSLFDGLLEPGLRLWVAVDTATQQLGGFGDKGTVLVFEPQVRTHVPFTKDKAAGFDARLGFTLPAAGPLASGNASFNTSIWALRLTAGFFF